MLELSNYYRNKSQNGVKSEHVRHLKKYIFGLIENKGEVAIDDIINSGKPFIESYFKLTPEETKELSDKKQAQVLLKLFHIDGHAALAHNKETKSYKLFEEVDSVEEYNKRWLLMNLRSALSFAEGDMLDAIEAMIEKIDQQS